MNHKQLDDMISLRCIADADPSAISPLVYRGGLIKALDVLDTRSKRIQRLESALVELRDVDVYNTVDHSPLTSLQLRAVIEGVARVVEDALRDE
jgi:hypothetical protein